LFFPYYLFDPSRGGRWTKIAFPICQRTFDLIS